MLEPSEVDLARFVAAELRDAELALRIPDRNLPLQARLDAVLHAAMANPAAVSPSTYSILYCIHSTEGQS